MKVFLILTCLISSAAFARDITLSGAQAKAVYDTLSTAKLEGYQDGAMGKRFITIGAIGCFKSTIVNKEEMGCTFESQEGAYPVNVSLKSGYGDDDYQTVSEIRMVLSDVTQAEVQTQIERKELNIKKLACKMSGHNHVLDNIDIEVNYSCELTL